uniref:Methyltransferase n=1 Tax=Pithovirus LCPAC403 TaxID=2506596 RepID=A0A481ZAV1_9VIRU|nr:MAG: methyltransferase [Pithovirus LCPAC403]
MLSKLFEKHGSDKHRNGYTDLYESLFKNIRDRDLVILEIGVGCKIIMGREYSPGASLMAWGDYFPRARIFGTDVAYEVTNLTMMDGRVTTHYCDSTDLKQVADFMNEVRKTLDILEDQSVFDLIIDDGSHLQNSQIKTLRHFFPMLRKNGIWITEDIGGDSRNLGYKSCRKFHPPRKIIKEIIGEDTSCYVVHDWVQHDSAVLVISV